MIRLFFAELLHGLLLTTPIRGALFVASADLVYTLSERGE